MQLSLLDLPPIDEPEPVTAPISLTPPNPHTLAWLEAKADYYLKLMGRFMNGNRIPQEVRQAELIRAYEMREQVLAEIAKLERANGRV